MYRFNGLDIELTRGDSVQFKVTVTGREMPEGTIALFTVKRSPADSVPVIEKKLAVGADGVVLIGLGSADTDVQARRYYWDLRMLFPMGDGSYEVRTPMEYAAFTILGVIGNA